MNGTEPRPPADVMQRFGLRDATFVARSARATIWKTTRQTGAVAALKLYGSAGPGNETAGTAYLQAAKGDHVAEIYGHDGNATLLEWLDGPHLCDLLRSGEMSDAQAAHILKDIASALLHQSKGAHLPDMTTLDDWFASLFDLRYAPTCPDTAKRDIEAAKASARALLDSQPTPQALHGDLHHGNVRHGARGWCAFDAKGLFGDPVYELANAFRHPKGAREPHDDAGIIAARLAVWSADGTYSAARLAHWAFAKSALSIAWQANRPIDTHPDFQLLARLHALADTHPL